MKIAILGAGQMGAGIAHLLAKKGCPVNIWDRTPAVLKTLKSTSESPHLPGIKISGKVEIVTELPEAVRSTDLIVLAVPSFAVRQMCEQIARLGLSNSLPAFLMISKGLEKETAKLPFQIVEEILGNKQDILHLSGIGYPKELDKERPIREALASKGDGALLEEIKSLFQTHWLRIETTNDLLGVQLAGALKNVMVIGIGMATAGQDPESKKKLITDDLISQGVKEMKELGKAMGAKEETFEGPAGRGDLEFSADPLSRNFRLGEDIFHKGIDDVRVDLEKNKKTVEGLLSSFAAYKLTKKYGLNLPLISAVYEVIYEGVDPQNNYLRNLDLK